MVRDLGVGEYYHVYNRGVLKTKIFLDQRDWARFLFSILNCQSNETFTNLNRQVTHFVRHRVFNIDEDLAAKVIRNRTVGLVAFSLMPNHFHLLLQNTEENGISRYMQRVLNSYTKYFNTRYQKSGHLFQGPYQSVLMENNDQLLHLSAYIHKHKTEWSSTADYLNSNRWGALLMPQIIIDQFTGGTEYGRWLKENPAKDPAYLEGPI